jgi:hypothetical protein
VHYSSLKFTLALNSDLMFWKMLVFESFCGISETVLRSMSTVLVKLVVLLNAFELLMLFIGEMTYLESNCFP